MADLPPSYHEILRRLRDVETKQNHIALLNGLVICVILASFLIVDAVILERAFSMGTEARTILFFLVVFGTAAAFVWFVVRPLLSMAGALPRRNIETIALHVGNHFPNIRDRLLDALQVVAARQLSNDRYSSELVNAAFADIQMETQDLDFTHSVDTRPLQRTRKTAMLAVIPLVVTVLVSPSGFFGSVHRILHFNTVFVAPSPIEFVVEPGNAEVVRGETVPLTIRASGKAVELLTLHSRQYGETDYETRELRPSKISDGRESVFQDSIVFVRATTEYFVEASDVRSEMYMIKVVDRPLIRSLRVNLRYPAYTQLPPRPLEENVGDVSAYPGTTISVDLSASKELSSASLVFRDQPPLPMHVEQEFASARFVLREEGTYRIELRDADGLTNGEPIDYQLKLIPDVLPSVSIPVPGRNVDLAESMQMDMLIRITDDFGFSGLRLAHRLVHSRYERPSDEFTFISIPIPSKEQNKQNIWYRWNLTGMRLAPEDVLAYHVEVFDNDDVNGPKSARSEIYLLRLPSLDEVFRDVAQAQTQSMESLQSAQSDLQQMKKQMDELRNEMKSNRDKADWQQQKKAEQLQKAFEEMQKKVEEAVRKVEENIERMHENRMLSPETLEKYLELQKLMQEMNSPELQQALKRLQEAMKQATPEQIREAMQRLQMTEEIFRKSLERTIELLKRIAIEQKLDELLKRAEELARQQEEVREQTAKTDTRDQQRLDELARRQQDLQKQLDAIQKELSALRKSMEEFPRDMPLEEMAKSQDSLNEQRLDQDMQSAVQQIQQGRMQQAQSSQRRISQGMQQFMEHMRAAQKSMRENQQRQIANEMRRAIQDMLELSKRQEELKEETRTLEPTSQRFRDNTQRQMEILGDLANVTNSLGKLSRKTFAVSPEMGHEIGKAMQQMSQAMQGMEQRNPTGTGQSQNEAMGSLNRAAMMLQNAMNSLMQGGGMGMAGLMQQLGQMSGMQAGINAQSQSMTGEQGMGGQQAAEWGRLAGEQGAVRKSLEDLAREAEQSGELSKLLGDLNRIAEEMREVQTDMEQNNVNPETLRKQERILSRLLDSQRSMRERDYEKRRRAEAGTNIVRRSPEDIDLATQEGRSKLRQELLKVLEQQYSKDYEDLIRRYFEMLEKEEVLE
jgi:hypothetical protein